MVVVVMRQFDIDIAGAVEWIRVYHEELQGQFMEKYREVPRWGDPVDGKIARYIDGMANWVRGCDQWHFESQRYFGKDASEIQRTRWVRLLPRTGLDSEEAGALTWDIGSILHV